MCNDTSGAKLNPNHNPYPTRNVPMTFPLTTSLGETIEKTNLVYLCPSGYDRKNINVRVHGSDMHAQNQLFFVLTAVWCCIVQPQQQTYCVRHVYAVQHRNLDANKVSHIHRAQTFFLSPVLISGYISFCEV